MSHDCKVILAILELRQAYNDCRRQNSSILTPRVCQNDAQWEIVLGLLREGYYARNSVVDIVWTGSTRLDDDHFVDENGKIFNDIFCTTKNMDYFKFPTDTKVSLVKSSKYDGVVDEFWTNEYEKVQRSCLCYRKF